MSFSNRYTTSVFVEKFVSNDGYGKASYEPPVDRKINFQLVDEVVTDEHGDEVRSNTVLYFYDPTWVSYEDRVTLPNGQSRIVVKVRQSPSIMGRELLVKVWLK